MTKKEEKDNINSNVSPKKERKHKKQYNFRDRKNKKKQPLQIKNANISDDDNDTSSDYDPMLDETEELEEVDKLEFQRFIQKLFPSKNQQQKIKQMEKLEKMLNNTCDVERGKKRISPKKQEFEENTKVSVSSDETRDEVFETTKKKKKKKVIRKRENKSEAESGSEADSESEADSGSDYDCYSEEYEFPEEDEELDDDEMEEMLKNNMKFNIVFTVGEDRNNPYDMDDEAYDEYLDEYGEDDEIYEDTSDQELSEAIKKEETKMKKNKNQYSSKYKKGDNIKVKLNDWDKFYKGKIIKVHSHKTKRLISYDIKMDNKEYENLKRVKSKYIKKIEKIDEYSDTLNDLEKLVKTNKNKGRTEMIKQFKKLVEAKEKKSKELEKKNTKKTKEKNALKFKKLLRQKNTMNDFKYFKMLELSEQKNILQQLEEVSEYNRVDVPHKLTLLECDIPVEYKSVALKKINTLAYMDPGAGEYYKTKQWVDYFMKIPFGKHNHLPVNLKDEPEKVHAFMQNAKKTLDDCCFGLNDAKMQIMQIVGQWISNPDSVGNAIALKGPPGTGKTTLVKEGVSKILNRPFVFIPLGGATDSSYLEGHSYTYEGSTWGKIVDSLITYKSMNPVFYFDELDKVSQTPKGEEIIGILTHLTDTTQNDKFHDKYFSNIDFDLNKCLFIFSYNDESKVNPILKDRMYRINTKGYNNDEKKIICKKYLIPKIEKNVNFKKEEIIIPDETINYINTNLVEKEDGVRNMKRAIEIIYTKLNLYRLMKKGTKLFDKQETLEISFPFTVSKEVVEKLIKKNTTQSVPFGMYV
jgi:ATP-dependent Lon protease